MGCRGRRRPSRPISPYRDQPTRVDDRLCPFTPQSPRSPRISNRRLRSCPRGSTLRSLRRVTLLVHPGSGWDEQLPHDGARRGWRAFVGTRSHSARTWHSHLTAHSATSQIDAQSDVIFSLPKADTLFTDILSHSDILRGHLLSCYHYHVTFSLQMVLCDAYELYGEGNTTTSLIARRKTLAFGEGSPLFGPTLHGTVESGELLHQCTEVGWFPDIAAEPCRQLGESGGLRVAFVEQDHSSPIARAPDSSSCPLGCESVTVGT